MREAVGALLEDGPMRLPGVRTVYATTDPDNHRSQAVLLASGFRRAAEEVRDKPTRRGGSVLFRFERPLHTEAA
jgi:RimJ/RimL family protein N-acetyltransferase